MRRILTMLAIVVGLTACQRVSPETPVPTPPIQGEAVSSSAPYFDMEVERPAPDFTLINQDGETVSLSDYRGSFVLLNFIYTSCPDVCPLMTASFRRLQDELGDRLGSGVFFLSITIDPEFDTPERLKKYAEAFQANLSGWSFLTGDPDTVYQVTDDYQQTFEIQGPRNIDHTALTVLIDPAGVERHRYWGTGYPPSMVVEHIEALGQQGARETVLSAAADLPPAPGPVPDRAEVEALLGIPQGRFIFLIDDEEAERFVGTLVERLLAQGWTETLVRSGPDQEAHFFGWGQNAFIGVGRSLDAVVVLQDSDPVRLWTEFFDRFKLYCCGS